MTVQYLTITEENREQRVDNFLQTHLKGVPKSLIYRIIRKGEIRVNKKRVKPEYKLQINDVLRIPPVRVAEKNVPVVSAKLNVIQQMQTRIIYEDDQLIIFNKPSGLAVHGGSGLKFGVIEGLRVLRPEVKYMELVHRLDRDTSGVLIIAKKRSVLRSLHEQLRMRTVEKCYLALVRGSWPSNNKRVIAPLLKNVQQSGERIVKVDDSGKPSETRFKIEKQFTFATLVRAYPITGRTHQIRVHALHAGHPIAFDPRYGDVQFDEQLKGTGLNRLFLHAYSVRFLHTTRDEVMTFEAPLDPILEDCLDELNLK